MNFLRKIKFGFWLLRKLPAEISLFEVYDKYNKVVDLVSEAKQEVVMGDGSKKPGWKTTEFWLTLLANVPGVVCTLGGESNPWCLAAGVLATVAYNWKRGSLKEKLAEAGQKFVEKEATKG